MSDHQAFLQALLAISRQMASIRAIDELTTYTMEVIVDLVHAQRGYLLLQERTGNMTIAAQHDTLPSNENGTDGISFSILNRALDSRKPIRITNAINDPTLKEAGSVKEFQLRSVMCVPLIAREQVLGAIYVENRERANRFKEQDLEKLTVFANQTAVSIENAILTAEAQRSRERIVVAREEERRRIRRDLHDELGPTLAAILLELDAARSLINQNPLTAIELLDDASSELYMALDNVRRIAHNLRPSLLDELGLIPAIREFITTLARKGDIQIHLVHAENLPSLSAATEVALYRITLEALANVIKHAHATECIVNLTQKTYGNWLTLTIEDNGIGFSDKVPAEGIGLTTMRERAEELSGFFVIESRQGEGTHIRVELPVPIKEKIS
jgi:signal transduction histidine kinase